MGFEWDELKRRSNLIKHDIDFIDAQAVFDGRPLIIAQNVQTGEIRFLVTAEFDRVFLTVIWTIRQGNVRIISARRASREERRNYRSVHG
jgi:uncharacterized DUF497 family protein